MTQSSAEKLANIVIGAAVIGAAVYVLKRPHLRRLAWQWSLVTMTGMVPEWISREIREGWEASGRPSGSSLPVARAS